MPDNASGSPLRLIWPGMVVLLFLLVSTGLVLAALGWVKNLIDFLEAPLWLILLPFVLAQTATALSVLYTAKFPTPAKSQGDSPGRSAEAGPDTVRPPRDVTDAAVQSVGGVMIQLECEHLPTELLANILQQIHYAHKKLAREVVYATLGEEDSFNRLNEQQKDILASRLIQGQVLTVDSFSTGRGVEILVAIESGMLVSNSALAILYNRLAREGAERVRDAMVLHAAQAVKWAVQDYIVAVKEKNLPRLQYATARLTGRVRRWVARVSTREGRQISEAVPAPLASAVFIPPVEPEPTRTEVPR